MGAFPALPLGKRPVRGRVLAVYRLDPERLAELLPSGLRPRLLQGHAVACALFTRLGSAPLLGPRFGSSDHLAYRFAVQRADGSDATWIARRETSSWLGARCGAKLLRREYGRSAFRVVEDALRLEIAVRSERGEEFYLRGENAGPPREALFRSAQALEAFLDASGPVQPHDVFAPEADELDRTEAFAPEPLSVFESRSAFLSASPFGAGAAVLDGAWRIRDRCLAVAARRRHAFRVLPERGSSAPALPST
jgi:hypothetical protein